MKASRPGSSRPGSAGLLTQRLLALFAVGWALFDFPLLGLGFGAGAEATLLGLPRLPVLLFAGWVALIVLLAWLMERADGEEPAERGVGLPEAGRVAGRVAEREAGR